MVVQYSFSLSFENLITISLFSLSVDQDSVCRDKILNSSDLKGKCKLSGSEKKRIKGKVKL